MAADAMLFLGGLSALHGLLVDALAVLCVMAAAVLFLLSVVALVAVPLIVPPFVTAPVRLVAVLAGPRISATPVETMDVFITPRTASLLPTLLWPLLLLLLTWTYSTDAAAATGRALGGSRYSAGAIR